MGSSGGGDSGAGSMAMMMQGSPMPGLPVAGKDTAIDPYTYGKFQNFLPEIKAEGQNDMATGLRPDMFKYRSPGGIADEGGGVDAGGSGGVAGEIKALRDELAKLTAGGAASSDNSGIMGGGSGNGGFPQYGDPNAAAKFMGGGSGGIGTMGMGGGGGAVPSDVQQRLRAAGYMGNDNPYVGQTSVSPQGLATSRHSAVGPQFDEAQNVKNMQLLAASLAPPKVV